MPESRPRPTLEPQIASQISLNLARRYGTDLTTEFAINPDIAWGNADSRRKRRLGRQCP